MGSPGHFFASRAAGMPRAFAPIPAHKRLFAFCGWKHESCLPKILFRIVQNWLLHSPDDPIRAIYRNYVAVAHG